MTTYSYPDIEWFKHHLEIGTSLNSASVEAGVTRATLIYWEKKYSIRLKRVKPTGTDNWIEEKLSNIGLTPEDLIKEEGSVFFYLSKKYKLTYRFLECFSKKYNVEFKKLTSKERGESQKKMYAEKNQCTFLDEIDSREKAYFLGLIAADGFTWRSKMLSITLHKQDGYLLEKFRELIGEGSVYHIESTNSVRYTISNSYLGNSLIRHNIVPRKTESFRIPDTIPDEFMRYFILGFFDGDGHINKQHGNIVTVNAELALQLASEIERGTGDSVRISHYKRKSPNHKDNYTLYLGRRNKSFFDWIYDNNYEMCLKRKKDIYIEFWSNYTPKRKVKK